MGSQWIEFHCVGWWIPRARIESMRYICHIVILQFEFPAFSVSSGLKSRLYRSIRKRLFADVIISLIFNYRLVTDSLVYKKFITRCECRSWFPLSLTSAKKYFSSHASRGTQRTGCKLRIQAPTRLPSVSGRTRRTKWRSERNRRTHLHSGPIELQHSCLKRSRWYIRLSEAKKTPLKPIFQFTRYCIYAFTEFYILR